MRTMIPWLMILALLLAGCAPGPSRTPMSSPTVLPATPTPLPTLAPTATPTAIETPLPPGARTYYRLRLAYSTTSDWSTLEFMDTTNILSLRLMDTRGAPTNMGVAQDQIALNQPLEASQKGQFVEITVDYALNPDAVQQPLALVLKKGDIGTSIVRVSTVEGEQESLLREVTHTGTVRGSAGLNPLQINLDLAPLKTTVPLVAQTLHPDLQKMVWAFYYPWYALSDWSSPQLKDRPLAPYASSDPQTMQQQIEQAQSAGIDGFISSWWGPGSYTDRNLKVLLGLAQEKNFQIAIYFETLTDNGPRDKAEILNWLAYAISTYRDQPAFMKVDGKPLIVVWTSGTVPLATWKTIFAELEARGHEATYLGMGYDAANLDVFDGIHDYGVFTYPKLAEVYQNMAWVTRNYALLVDAPAAKIWAATVQPGYDERLIPGRQGLFQERANGQFYRSTFEAALQSDPDWIFITTWNEWWEHTYIEPSELYGDQYLQITREYAERWKGK